LQWFPFIIDYQEKAMNHIPQSSDKLRNVIKWISDEMAAHPEKTRNEIILDAEIRFDLSPRDCQFLQEKFMDSK
jgi:hypothetical protein